MNKIWQTLKAALGIKKDKSSFPQSFLVNNKEISDKQEIAQSFNNFFSNIGKTTSENVPISNNHFSVFLKQPLSHSMFIEPIEPFNLL